MRRELFYWELWGFVFTGALGAVLHFLYGWSGENPAAAAFSGDNESTWEHMTLLVVPVFLFSVAQVCALGRECPHLLWCRAVSTLVGLALIPVLFYTYTGVLGRHLVWVDIAIFYLADGALFALDGWLLRRGGRRGLGRQLAGLSVLWGLMFTFVLCTFRPPHIALWQDPETGRYGIEAEE